MNNEKLKQLIAMGYKNWEETPEDDSLWTDITHQIFNELAQNLEDAIVYINSCSEKELYFVSQVFEELSKHFNSQKLIDCVENNVTRFQNKTLQDQIKMELEYMKLYV